MIESMRWQSRASELIRAYAHRKFSDSAKCRVLILSENNKISQSQIFPFYFYEDQIYQRWGHSLCEVNVDKYELCPESYPGGAHVVIVQTWFDLKNDRCENLFSAIRKKNPSARIVFFDSFAPTDLRLAEMVFPHIDIYLKKHLLKDRLNYFKSTMGDTNLSSFYGERYGEKYPIVKNKIPDGFMDKVLVGPTFFTSKYLLPKFWGASHASMRKPEFDVHSRLAVNGGGWYGHMRSEAVSSANKIVSRNVLTRPGIPFKQYIFELKRSRICFSPFGYGEVCWRDYEAVLCGALLIKPCMSHIETKPNIFVPYETYIPVRWDFSDLEEKVSFYLSNEKQRIEISRNAYKVLHDYCRGSKFLDQIAPIFSFC